MALDARAVTATAWTEYTYTINAHAGEHRIEIDYGNDYEDASCIRNLYVDNVKFWLVPATSFEAEGMTVTADCSWSDPNPSVLEGDTTASAGYRLKLWTYGTASNSVTTAVTTSQIEQAAGYGRARMSWCRAG